MAEEKIKETIEPVETHDSIVAPLKKIIENLKNHIRNHTMNINKLSVEKVKIEKGISNSRTEISKSDKTAKKIGKLIS